MTNALCTVDFHGHTHTLIENAGEPFVAMKPIVEAIGLDWAGQFTKIKAHPVMGSTVEVCPMVGADGRMRELFTLPLKYLNGWLFGVDARRVKPALRDTLIAYQRECFDVLDRHWRGANRVDDQHGSPEPDAPPMPASVNHRVDHVVASARIFRSLLRTGEAIGLPKRRAVEAANSATVRATGYDLAAELGWNDDDAAAIGHDDAGPAVLSVASWLRWLRGWPPGERPQGPIRAGLAHAHYADWCNLEGHIPVPINRFVRTLRVDQGVRHARKRLRNADGTVDGPVSVLYLGTAQAPPTGTEEAAWIGACDRAFRKASMMEPAT